MYDVIDLDAQVFGIRRPNWVGSLFASEGVAFYGKKESGNLLASLVLRPRRNNALCLDAVNGRSFKDAEQVLLGVFAKFPNQKFECFVKDGSTLDLWLRKRGFQTPEFFKKIGPLVEWRKGKAKKLRVTDNVQCLSWF